MKESSGVNQPYLYYGKVTCSHTDTLGSSVLTVYAVLFFNYFQLLRFRLFRFIIPQASPFPPNQLFVYKQSHLSPVSCAFSDKGQSEVGLHKL